MEAGRTYYVQAAAYGSSTGRYTLTFQTTGDDFGDAFADAHPIALNASGAGSQSGVIETAGDVDMFRLVAPMTGRLTVKQVADCGLQQQPGQPPDGVRRHGDAARAE